MPRPASLDARLRAHVFLRTILDQALIDAPDDVEGDPLKYFDRGRSLPLTIRFCAALDRAGYMTGQHNAGTKRVDGIRRRLDMEDFVNLTLIAVGRSGLRGIIHNDQARDALVRCLYDTLHSKRVTLVRRKALGEQQC